MREIVMILHFLGLALGLGTSFAFMFLGIANSKMEKDEARQFAQKTNILSKMGHIGITLLIISGLYLMTPYWSSLTAMPTMMAKLAAVVILTVMIVILSVAGKKARTGDTVQLQKMEKMGKVALLLGIAIVVLAVFTFH